LLRLSKKATVITTGMAMLMALGTSSAIANRGDNHKETICHATGSATNPFVRINVSEHSAKAYRHHQHGEDDFLGRDDANVLQCDPPVPPVDDNDDDDTTEPGNCSAESTSGDSTAVQSGLVNVGNVNLNLGNLGSNLLCQSDIVSNLTASVLGTALGGGGLLSVGGLLGVGMSGVLSGLLSADAGLLAEVLVLF
jgi:hypothetical protein